MKDNKFVKLEDGTIVNVENISLIYFKKEEPRMSHLII